jgi:DNA-binding SARP family transcriptional activator/tetratricopeptide (TPR) repeat protein
MPPFIRLAGVPVAGRDEADARPLERKDAALLALLAIDGASPRDRVAAWLWPEVPAKTAAGSLRQRIFRLRKRLGHELLRAADVVVLLPDVAPLTEGGEPLAGLDYADCPEFAAWLERQRGQRHARRVDALAERAARQETAGELAAAIATAVALLAEEPLSDHAARRLMRLHYLRGDRAAAIRAFERFERRLKDELGARPGLETLALLRTIEGDAPPARVGPRRPVPAALQRPPRLVGRQRELAALAEALAAGHVFLVVGEAGMGKSRLLAEWLAVRPRDAEQDAEARTLLVAARPGDAGVPYALLARLLRALFERMQAPADAGTQCELARVLPEWSAGRPAGEAQRLVLQHAVEDVLRGAPAAGIDELLLDDLHFADAASLELLQGLIAGDRLRTLRWGLAQRPGEGLPAAQRLREVLVDTQRLREVPLSPLDAAAMAELVAGLGLTELNPAELAAPLVRHTGGNPLFALETLKDLVLRGAAEGGLPQPASVGALIERRLRTLSADALALARVAAIGGVDFGIELAEAVLQRPALALADAWAELQAAQVLAGSAFAHDLVFDAVLRTVPEAISRHVHGAVAAALAARGSEPARTGAHWEAAGRWPEAATMLERAADAARHAGRVGEALALRRRAAAAHGQAGDAQARWRVECDSVELIITVQGPGPAQALVERLLDEAGSAAQRMAALVGLALVHAFAGQPRDVLAASEQALEAAGGEAGAPVLLDARRLRAHALSQLGRAPDAVAELRALQPLVDAGGSLRRRYQQRSSLAYALNLCARPLECDSALLETIALAREAGDLAEVMSSLANLAVSQLNSGRAAQALEHALAARALRERVGAGEGPHMAINDMNTGVMACLVGRFDLALELLERAPERLAPIGELWVAIARRHLAAMWLVLGQPYRAAPWIDDPLAADNPVVARRSAVLLARLARARGADPAAVAATLSVATAALRAAATVKDTASFDLETSRLVERTVALELVRGVQRDATGAGLEGLALHARVREIELLLDVDPGHAAALAVSLDAAAADLVLTDGYLPELWLTAARAARAAGDLERARESLRRGGDWIDAAAGRLPAGLRSPFLEGNPVNRALRAALAAAG